MYMLWLELVNSDNSVAVPDVNAHKTCNEWYLPASISVDGSNYSALIREIQSDHSNSATYQQLYSSRLITTALQSVSVTKWRVHLFCVCRCVHFRLCAFTSSITCCSKSFEPTEIAQSVQCLGNKLDGQKRIVMRFPEGVRDLSLLESVDNGTRTHPASGVKMWWRYVNHSAYI
jgi:hypothetical protein